MDERTGLFIIVTSAIQGFFVGAFITGATGGNYMAGEVGMVGLGGAIVGGLIPFVLLTTFKWTE